MKYLSLEHTAVSDGDSIRMQLRSRGFRRLECLSAVTERFWLSRWYFPVMLLLASVFVAANQHVVGTAVLLCLGTWFLALCPDFLASVCPIVMVCVLVGPKYEDLSGFVPCCILLVPLSMALLLHLMIWPVTIRAGRSARGLVLVSLATLLGGCDVMRREEFWAPISLYYTVGLGVVMLLLYLLFRSYLTEERSYDLHERFAAIFYVAGLLMAVVVFASYAWRWQAFMDCGHLLFLKYRNYAATMLLSTLPMSFYLALRSRRYLAGTAVMVLAMVLTASRSALLFGAVELLLGCIYLVRCGVISKRAMMGLLMVGGAAMALFGVRLLGMLYASRMVDGHLISGDETRWKLLARGISDFLYHPVFGMGLGNTINNNLLKSSVPGSMFFYHNLPVQVLASMGLLGMVAYGRLISDRISLLLRGRSAYTMALGMCYLGMLMVSMTNPGEFCPFPNAGMMVMVFAAAEEAVGDVAMPVSQMLGARRYARRSHGVPLVHNK